MSITRRQFVIGSLAGGLACCLPMSSTQAWGSQTDLLRQSSRKPTAEPPMEARAGGIRIAGDASVIVLS